MRLNPTKTKILSSTHVEAIPVASDAVVYTQSFPFGNAEYYALDYIATSAGVVGLKIELEQSNVKPTTEGSADDNYVVAENSTAIETALADEVQHFKKLSPVVSKYGRLKITGVGANAATTTIKLGLVRQEEV